jgi:hypothetical protein
MESLAIRSEDLHAAAIKDTAELSDLDRYMPQERALPASLQFGLAGSDAKLSDSENTFSSDCRHPSVV